MQVQSNLREFSGAQENPCLPDRLTSRVEVGAFRVFPGDPVRQACRTFCRTSSYLTLPKVHASAYHPVTAHPLAFIGARIGAQDAARQYRILGVAMVVTLLVYCWYGTK